MSRSNGKDTKHLALTPEAEAIDQMDWRGNIMPSEWCKWIKYPNGLTDLLSCVLLAEIVYWYRGTGVWKNGKKVAGLRSRKFDADLLQLSYDYLSDKFGISKRQIREAMGRLEKAGLIERVFRHIKVKGRPVNNVLYIKIFIAPLDKITNTVPEPTEEHLTVERDMEKDVEHEKHLTFHSESMSRSTVIGDAPQRHTNTKSTTKSTVQREEEPKSFASEGLDSASPSSAPADLPVDDEAPEPPEDEADTSHIPAAQSPGFPKLPGCNEGNYLKAAELYDLPASIEFTNLFPGCNWNQNRARQYLRYRRKGELRDKDLNLLTRYFREAVDMSDTPWRKPQDPKALLSNLSHTLSVVRGYARAMLEMNITDLRSAKHGDMEITGCTFARGFNWTRSKPQTTPPREMLDAAPPGAHWACRASYALAGIYPAWTDADRTTVNAELADDPQILAALAATARPIDPTKVFDLSLEEIKALNATFVAERQASVDAIQSLL